MNNLKYIKGDDPACYRGDGQYLVIASPNDSTPDLLFKARGHLFMPDYYYAGPINPINPINPSRPTRRRRRCSLPSAGPRGKARGST